jgi:hypothetical protein
VQWLRILPNLEWFPHPFLPCMKHLSTFKCCGWAYGSVILPLPPHVFADNNNKSAINCTGYGTKTNDVFVIPRHRATEYTLNASHLCHQSSLIAIISLAFVLSRPLVLLLCWLVVPCCVTSVASVFAAHPSFG